MGETVNGVVLLLVLLIALVGFLFVWRSMIYLYQSPMQQVFNQLNFTDTPSQWNDTAYGFKSRLEPYMYNLPYLFFFLLFVMLLAVIFSRQAEGQEYQYG